MSLGESVRRIRVEPYANKHAIEVLAYCLMTNHVHLVVVPKTPDGLHRALKPLHMRHAQRINRAHGWKGHLWQGRYFSSPLDDDYLWAAIRYVEVNPVRAHMTSRAEDYRWSSAAAHCGMDAHDVLTKSLVWRQRFTAIGNWSRWLAAGEEPQQIETLRRHAVKGLPCGSPAFVAVLEQTSGRMLQPIPQGRAPKGTLPFKG
jgi:putative transposase